MCEMNQPEASPLLVSEPSLRRLVWQEISNQVLPVIAHDIQGALTPLDGYIELLLSDDLLSSEEFKQKQRFIFENMLLATRQLSIYGDHLNLISQLQANTKSPVRCSSLNACIDNLIQRLAPFFAERTVFFKHLETPTSFDVSLDSLTLCVLLRIIIFKILKQAQPDTELTVNLEKIPMSSLKRHLQFSLQSHQLWASYVHLEEIEYSFFIQCRFQYRGNALVIEDWQTLAKVPEPLSPYFQQGFQDLEMGLLHQVLADSKLALYHESHAGVGTILDIYLPYVDTAGRI